MTLRELRAPIAWALLLALAIGLIGLLPSVGAWGWAG